MLGCFSPALPTWSWQDGSWRVPCPIKLPVLSQLGCGRRQGRDARRKKEQSVNHSFGQARDWLRYSFFSLRGKEEGIKRNRTRTGDAGGISEIPNLVGHPMRALLS